MMETGNMECNPVSQAAEASWDELFEFQRNYRLERKLTGTAFLRQLDLPGTVLPYLYSKARQPRKKPSSLGGQLRAAINGLQMSPPDICERNLPTDLLQEYFIAHKSVFTDQGIFAVDINDEGELEIFSEKGIDVSEVTKLFADLEMDGSDKLMDHITVSVFLPAAKFESPVAIRSGLLGESPTLGFGTLTPIFGEFGLFGLTAKHCLLPPGTEHSVLLNSDAEIDVYGYPETSSITSRRVLRNRAKIGVFARACLGYNDDIAVVMLSENHAYVVNEVRPEYTIQFGDFKKAGDIAALKGNVLKVGISTLVTRGEICKILPAGGIMVRSIECTCFAAAGDSGALIVSDEDDSRGLVLGIIVQTHVTGRAMCVPISALYDIDLIKDC